MYSKVVFYDYAMSFIGLPYLWGGDDPIKGFDCSGLVIELLTAVGVIPTRVDMSAAQLHAYFKNAVVTDPEFGTLAFFGGDNISHVALCINKTLMLEAGGGTPATLDCEAAAKQNAYIKIRPISHRSDFKGFRHPPYPWKG